MSEHAELDIILRWAPATDAFDVTLIFDHPRNAQDYQEFVDDPLHFDTAKLEGLRSDSEAYSHALTDMVFRDGQLRVFFARAVLAAATMPVHVRLVVDPRSPARYQSIRWEALLDPERRQPLTTSEGIRFSRFLNSSDWSRVTAHPREGSLQGLIVVADPSDISDYAPAGQQLAAVDVEGEVARAREALAGMSVRVLPAPDGRLATIDNIVDELRDGVDVLYLACHGTIEAGSSLLYLQDDRGEVDKVAGKALAGRIADLARRPAVAVLCSCQSAGPGDEYLPSEDGALTPLGPMLAEVGIGTVVAMQGNVTMTTTARFLPRFFQELSRDGVADRAMAIARGTVKDRPDWWMPVLFSRLRRGRAWYEPRFGGRERAMFEDLRGRIIENNCLPVLGSGIAGEGFMPSREELARSWVDRRQMPITASSQDDLAQVAQYLAVDSGPDMPRTELARYLRTYLKRRHGDQLPGLEWDRMPLQEVISEVGRHERQRLGSDDLHAILASLEMPIYITTSWNRLLEDALVETGRAPEVRYFDWYRQLQDDDPLITATVERPLVYHLFGTIDRAKSVVLTEDDYFAWLRAWIKRVDKGDSIPTCVKAALTTQSLLFLGYGLADWEFRVLFQSIKSFEGNANLRDRGHVGVQLSPESIPVDRDSAQEYLQQYLDEDRIDIYWGQCTEFLRDLRDSEVRV